VELYLLTPCPDLWRRCGSRRHRLGDALALADPLDTDWLLEAPGLEARFGRLGAEFQQLLEGTGEVQFGASREEDLFLRASAFALPAAPATTPAQLDRDSAAGDDPQGSNALPDQRDSLGTPTLLHQLQEQLAEGTGSAGLRWRPGDASLEFHACPGPLRQVQIVRDRLLQLMAADPSLEPRDILVMTPQVDRLAPLVGAMFGDSDATGVSIPWRLTDRSQQGEGGIGRTLLALLQLGGERLTASGLEAVLACGALQERFGLTAEACGRLNDLLQRTGFRWGLDGPARGGDPTHSLAWAIDRLLLGLVLPADVGLAPGLEAPTAPAPGGAPLELSGRWLHLLTRLRHWLRELGRPANPTAWAERLRILLADLFGEGGGSAAELPGLLAALDSWQELAGDSPLLQEAPVVAAVLQEALGAESGRFGHRSGALTISALEPMRAIPHRVVVLMGLDAGVFPRAGQRPGFHLMEQRRRLGDPLPADQDRYVLLEALLSARSHLLITWSCREERRGERLQPAAPVRQWLEWLGAGLAAAAKDSQDQAERTTEHWIAQLLVAHAASPLERANFRPHAGRPPASCDRRQLAARRLLDQPGAGGEVPLLRRPMPATPGQAAGVTAVEPFDDLRAWLMAPQRQWLRELGLRPAEWERSLEDLEPLALGERERSGLLRSLPLEAASPDPQAPEQAAPEQEAGWLERCRGLGLLPPGSGAVLEARRLEARRQGLVEQADALGDPWQGEVMLAPWRSRQEWRGDAVLVVHWAKGGAIQLLDLWLQLVLAAAAAPAHGRRPGRGVLLAREQGDRMLATTLAAPEPEAALAELERLAALRERWRLACWPVPPRTGWAWWEAEHKDGSGAAAARAIWEGGPQQRGERDTPEMVACFGGALPLVDLLEGSFADLARELFAPVQAAVVPRPRGKG
jgi:exodeoxyribonuclease V gamma subunit